MPASESKLAVEPSVTEPIDTPSPTPAACACVAGPSSGRGCRLRTAESRSDFDQEPLATVPLATESSEPVTGCRKTAFMICAAHGSDSCGDMKMRAPCIQQMYQTFRKSVKTNTGRYLPASLLAAMSSTQACHVGSAMHRQPINADRIVATSWQHSPF